MTSASDQPQSPFPFPTAEHHPAHPAVNVRPVVHTPAEDAIDSGIEESFPASDPVSVTISKAVPASAAAPAPAVASTPPASSVAVWRTAAIVAGTLVLVMGWTLASGRRRARYSAWF